MISFTGGNWCSLVIVLRWVHRVSNGVKGRGERYVVVLDDWWEGEGGLVWRLGRTSVQDVSGEVVMGSIKRVGSGVVGFGWKYWEIVV